MTFTKIASLLECKAGSGTPLYSMFQKRQETEVTRLSLRWVRQQ